MGHGLHVARELHAVRVSEPEALTAIDARGRATERLGERRDAETCDAVCRGHVSEIEAAFAERAAEGAALACSPGCALCCHLRVGVFAHEAVALLRHLRTEMPAERAASVERRISENAQLIDGLTPAEHYALRLPCAFLGEDGLCMAYAVRPSSCARYHSLSRARCEHAFEHPRDMGTPRNSRPALLALQRLGAALDAATSSALERVALHATKSELHLLLRALLRDPALLERWRAGEDVALAVGSVDGEPTPS